MIKIRLASRIPTKERPKFNASQKRAYTPEQTRRDTASILRAMEVAMGGRPPAMGPVRLSIRAEVATEDEGRLGAYAMETPDLDNLEKIIKDAGNSLVYGDDRQVADVVKRRVYATETQVLIELSFLDSDEADLFNEKEAA